MSALRTLHRELASRSLPQLALGAMGYPPAQADLIATGLWYAWRSMFGRAAA